MSRAEANGSIDPGEARQARADIEGTYRWIHYKHYEDGGRLSPEAQAEVQQHIDHIFHEVRWDHARY